MKQKIEPAYSNLEEVERDTPHKTPAFMFYLLGKTPYGCQSEWAERLDDADLLYQADFEPRDHGKSELFTLAYPLRMLCLNPNIRILIIKNTKASAIKAISVIKTQLERNERLKAFYAAYWQTEYGVEDICNSDSTEGQSQWGAGAIYVKRTLVSQDPTVEAVGVGGAITGGHYDIIIVDDAEDPARMKTDTAYMDQIDWFTGTILQLREPWTKIIVVGTFKRASGDLYDMIRQNPLWSTTIQSAIISPKLDEITYERVFNKEGRLVGVKNIRPKDIKVLCPEKWGIERLLMDREGAITPGQTDNTWRREKMNDLSAFKENIFKKDWMHHRYPLSRIEDRVIDGVFYPYFKAVISGWDTAHTEKKQNDKSAFSVGCSLGIADDGYYLMPTFFRAQVEYPKLKQAFDLMYLKVRPNVVIVEYKDTGIALFQEMRQPHEFMGQRLAIPMIPYEPDNDKVARAQASTPAWDSGLIWLPEDCTEEHEHDTCVNSWLPGWIDRHVDFPETSFKDEIDVWSMLVNYAQRFYPLYGMKNNLFITEEEKEGRLKSRIIDMQNTLGPTGRGVFVPRLASRVANVPGRRGGNSTRAVRSLPTGRDRDDL